MHIIENVTQPHVFSGVECISLALSKDLPLSVKNRKATPTDEAHLIELDIQD